MYVEFNFLTVNISQILIIFPAFVTDLRIMGIQRSSASALHTLQENLYDSIRREVLYNILSEFGIPMKLVRLIKMCLNETHNIVWVGNNLSDMFPITNGLKQGDALPPLLFNFVLEYAIRGVQVNQDGLKLNGTHQLVVYADDDIYWEEAYILYRKNVEVSIVASKESGLEVNSDKTRYMVMSRDQNAVRSNKMKTDNNSFEMAEEFKCLGTTITNKNSIHEEIKNRLKSGNACYHSVQNLLSSSLLSKNVKVKI